MLKASFLASVVSFLCFCPWNEPVSYTHLDVYKRQRWGRSLSWCDSHVQAFGPLGGGVKFQVGHAGNPGLDLFEVFLQQFWIDSGLDPEHQFFPFVGGFHCLGGELCDACLLYTSRCV